MQKLKRFSLLFLFLFTLPIAIGQLPFPNNEFTEKPKEPAHVVYAASQALPTQQPLIQQASPFHVLMLFTHSHETYKPVLAQAKGKGVNGVYNQDLAPNMLLIELGGIDNTEDELERTMAILAQAIQKAFVEKTV